MFNPQLQSGVYAEQPVQQVSGTEAAAGLASSLVGLGQTFFQAEAQREKSALEREKIQMKLDADEREFITSENTAALTNNLSALIDGAPNLVSGTTAAQEMYRKAAFSGNYTEQQLLEARQKLKSEYGISLGGMARGAGAEDLKVMQTEMERQQFIDNAVAYVDQFSTKYGSEVKPFVDSNGRLKNDYSAEDLDKLIRLGISIQTREAAEIAAIDAKYTGVQRRSKLLSRDLTTVVEKSILSELPAISKLPAGEGLAVFDELVARVTAGFSTNRDLLPEDIASQNAGVAAVVAFYRDKLSGKRVNAANAEAIASSAASVYHMAVNGSKDLQAIASLAAAGIPISPDGQSLAQSEIIKFIVENPQRLPKGFNPTVDEKGNLIDGGVNTNKTPLRALGDNWFRTFASPKVAVDDQTIHDVNGKQVTQADLVADQFITGLMPLNDDERQNFFGSGGLYTKLIREWSSNPKALENIGANVLSRNQVKESVLRAGSESLAQYLPYTMSLDLGFLGAGTIAADKIIMDKSPQGYPVLSGIEIPEVRGRVPRRGMDGKISLIGLTLDQRRYVEVVEQMGQINTLFKMQYDAAVNVSRVTGDQKIVEDVIASQMNALAMFSRVDDFEAALGDLIPED